jgi:hypothetical protein
VYAKYIVPLGGVCDYEFCVVLTDDPTSQHGQAAYCPRVYTNDEQTTRKHQIALQQLATTNRYEPNKQHHGATINRDKLIFCFI